MAINQHLWNIALNLQSIQEEFYQFFFRTVRSTKHLVDRVSADYIDDYMQGSGKLDKYGFSLLPAREIFNEVRRVFKFFHKIYDFKPIFAFKFQI